MANKGSPFEREISRKLSLWWSGGKHDDLFWRSSQSGGRATTRRKKGKKTRGHAGDITNTDSTGEPLIKFITFELKRGYNRCTPHDMLDAPPKQSAATVPGKRQKANRFDQFIIQAITASQTAETPMWAVVHKRDQRQAVIFFPYRLLTALALRSGSDSSGGYYSVAIRTPGGRLRVRVCMMLFDRFLACVTPKEIKTLYKIWRKYGDQKPRRR